MFAEVAFPISSFQSFTYRVPRKFISTVQIGSRVRAPLGKRSVQGVVVSLRTTSKYKGDIKSISGLVDNIPVLTAELWELILWISHYYVTPIGQVARTVLPGRLNTRYTPPKNWYVKSTGVVDEIEIDLLKRRAPKQYIMFKEIWKATKPLRTVSLKALASDPLSICRKLEKKSLVKLFQRTSLPDVTGFTFDPIHKEITFNHDQMKAVSEISSALIKKKYAPFLVHGVTGSGKTEIYIESVRQVIEQGRTGIILLPEISLTPQIAGRFRAVFGDTVALWHSRLTHAQRSWTWMQICQGSFKVVIGARSAIFAPLQNVGLIVIDEEQESSYQQDSSVPRYHARDVALMRGKLEKATVLLSSATPSLESYFNHLYKKLKYINLPKRFGIAKYPHTQVVDMLKDQDESGKFGLVISGLLLDKIEDRLKKNEQVLLLQNRRGYSPIIRCFDCGEIVMCSFCQVALTYHSRGRYLLCHVCGYTENQRREMCNSCRSGNLVYKGAGTQRIESLLKETFPVASITRLDSDSLRSGQQITKILKSFSEGKTQILIGTQMIAKGLDFPNITLVGIVNADLGLHLPDFRAGERIFQLIYQAAGRSGRGNKTGEVIIQTYSPDNPVIKCAARLDLTKYYNIALSERQELKYPPFSWLAKVECSGPVLESAMHLAERVKKSLSKKYKGLYILGPAPCYLEKIRNQFRFQIVFKSIKTLDPNGRKLHSYINKNFYDFPKKYQMGKNQLNIHMDPLSLI